MHTVKDLLDAKGRTVWTVHPDNWVYDAITLMADKEVGALMVAENEIPVGLISERDYARKVILKDRSSRSTRVSEIMASHIIFAREHQTVEECMAVMTARRIRHLPVLRHSRLAGIISIGDLVKTIIAEKQFIIEQLAHYIHGEASPLATSDPRHW